MSGALRAYNTYSVFVGKIEPDTKKYELRELFQRCGEIMDLVILQNSSTIHNFGFVRFADVDAAYKAVTELNGWNLKGSRLTVDISKDTAEKIRQGIIEKLGKPVTVVDGMGPKFNKHSKAQGENSRPRGTSYVADTMYRIRLEESCTALNMKHCDTGRLRMNIIQQDMDALKDSRCPTLWGSVDKPVGSFAEISHKIMESCKTKCEDGAVLGKKNAAEFMSALTTIMSEFDNVFDEIRKTGNKTESELSGQLKLDHELIKDIEEELTSSGEEELFKITENIESRSEVHRKGNAKSKTESKRLSDASVQTASMELDVSEQGKLVPRSVEDNSDSDLTEFDTGIAQRYYTAVGSSDSENDTSYIDPAIIDYHLSKMKEGEKEDCKKNKGEKDECNRSIENSDQPDIVKMLFSKMTVGNNSPNDLRRLSCDRKMFPTNSSGMNFVDIKGRKSPTVLENGMLVHSNSEDSGIFSDNCVRSKGRRSEGQLAGFQGIEDGGQIVNGAEENRKKHLHGSSSEPNLGTFDIQQYVLMSKGRGRGMFSDCSTKGSLQTSTGHNVFTGVGRGQLQTGFGRGQFNSWKRI